MATHQIQFTGKPSDLGSHTSGSFSFGPLQVSVLGIGTFSLNPVTVTTDSEAEGNWTEFMGVMGPLGWEEV